MLSAFLDRLRRVNGHLQPCIFSIYLVGRLFDSLGKLKRPHENIRIVTIIFSLCSGPTRSQSQAQAPAKAVWAQPQMKPTLPPPPSTHPLPSRKQQISQNKRWRYESYRLWMLWKTRLLKWSKDYKCCPPFYFRYKKIILCVPHNACCFWDDL